MTDVSIPTSRGEMAAYLNQPPGAGHLFYWGRRWTCLFAAIRNPAHPLPDLDATRSGLYGGLTADSERALPRACSIVASYGARDRWPGVP
jgi:carboxymethylenebutenolidase